MLGQRPEFHLGSGGGTSAGLDPARYGIAKVGSNGSRSPDSQGSSKLENTFLSPSKRLPKRCGGFQLGTQWLCCQNKSWSTNSSGHEGTARNAFPSQSQFFLGHGEYRESTSHTPVEIGKHENSVGVGAFQPWNVDANLCTVLNTTLRST